LRRLIINADDFGLTPGVNRAIAQCCERGVVTSATLMATGAAMLEASRLAAILPRLGVGCHVVLVDGSPLLPAAEVPSLAFADAGSAFTPTLGGFVLRALTGRFSATEIEAEAAAQFKKLQDSGLAISHFDTHKHTHIFPAVLRPLLRAARKCGIRAVRNPFVPARALAFEDLRNRPALWKRYWQTRALRPFLPAFHELLTAHGMVAPDGCLGVMETGFLDADLFAAMIRAVAETLPEGTWEMVCHPGCDDAELAAVRTRLRASRQEELEVLTSAEARSLLEKSGIELISYRDLHQGA
jgi:hopanoid biosynthesis associated protein HpnK